MVLKTGSAAIQKVYFIGIKGTGMCALAELMHNLGVEVSGSDQSEQFYTDKILNDLEIPYYESFSASHIPSGNASPDLVVYSAAYSFETNVEMAEARRRGISVRKFPDALGEYSSAFDSSAVAGVHGKTTTTALAGTILRGVGAPAQVLVGSAVSAFGDRSTVIMGDKYFVAETCEYKRHFLSFCPRRIVLTSIESDHQDYYPAYDDIMKAFMEFGRKLPMNGQLIYCADDKGASEAARALKKERPVLEIIPYGFSAAGDYGIESFSVRDESIVMRLRFFPGELKLRIPGRHTALNTAGAMALVSSILRKEFGSEGFNGWNDERREAARRALEEFRGSRRRTEILGQAGGILFIDDYGHHPTAIKSTIEGFREFYPGRRLVLSFMSHTYTRTASLLDEFAASFGDADIVLLHKIYSSAREQYNGGITGRTLYEKVKCLHSGEVFYEEESEDAADLMKGMLRRGDLFVTMGAGDNWKLGKKLFDFYSGKDEKNK